MFTSRVEYRLILREDNADLRLRKTGYNLGLISKADYLKTEKKIEEIKSALSYLKKTLLFPSEELNRRLEVLKSSYLKKPMSLEELLRRPELNFERMKNLDTMDLEISKDVWRQIEIEVKYSGFIKRQVSEIEKFKNLEKIRLPQDFDYTKISSLSREIKEKLNKFKPLNLGQASRISGVTPAAISILMIYLKKLNGER